MAQKHPLNTFLSSPCHQDALLKFRVHIDKEILTQTAIAHKYMRINTQNKYTNFLINMLTLLLSHQNCRLQTTTKSNDIS